MIVHRATSGIGNVARGHRANGNVRPPGITPLAESRNPLVACAGVIGDRVQCDRTAPFGSCMLRDASRARQRRLREMPEHVAVAQSGRTSERGL